MNHNITPIIGQNIGRGLNLSGPIQSAVGTCVSPLISDLDLYTVPSLINQSKHTVVIGTCIVSEWRQLKIGQMLMACGRCPPSVLCRWNSLWC